MTSVEALAGSAFRGKYPRLRGRLRLGNLITETFERNSTRARIRFLIVHDEDAPGPGDRFELGGGSTGIS